MRRISAGSSKPSVRARSRFSARSETFMSFGSKTPSSSRSPYDPEASALARSTKAQFVDVQHLPRPADGLHSLVGDQIAAIHLVGEKKQESSSFLKKRTKKLLHIGTRAPIPIGRACPHVKISWFFFFKKELLLFSSAKTPQRAGSSPAPLRWNYPQPAIPPPD
jgi:hypothetical protein